MNAMLFDVDRLEKAMRFAAHAHGTQTMKGFPEPYFLHLSLVGTTFMSHCGDLSPDEFNLGVQVCWLHDTIEDTDATHAEIRDEFGIEVANGVLAMTKDKTLPKPDALRKSIAMIRALGRPIRYAKIADRVINLSRIGIPGHWDAPKRRGYRDGGQEILDGLSMDLEHPLEKLLARRIREYPVD